MEALRRIGGDAVGLSALGIVIGTSLAALSSSVFIVILIALSIQATRAHFRIVFTTAVLAAFLIAGWRHIGDKPPIFDPLENMRDELLMPLVGVVRGDAGALAAGLTLGDADYFSKEFRDAMRLSSTSHLVALSGFNVALMLGFARRILRGKVSSEKEMLIGVALLATFVLLAGFQPSLVRAALMGSAVLLAGYLGRRIASGRLLIITAAVMMLLEPRIVTHLGFILSFISSWALLATVGDMEMMLARGKRLRALSGYILPSFVAQLGVAPALLASTGSVMLVGLIINPVLIPLTPVLTAISGIELILVHLAQGLGSVVSPLVALVTVPVTSGIALAANTPLLVSIALPIWGAVITYSAWFLRSVMRKPELW